jgi:hypothetical protein
MEQVAQIEWKGITWRAAYGDFSVRELLTILKGFGPMEVVEFEKPDCFRGRLSLSLTPEGVKEITVYHLEALGPKRMGRGREALNFLRNIFKGEVYVQDPGEEVIRVRDANRESILFWIKMFREGVIDALESSLCCLHRQLSVADVDRIAREVEGMLSAVKARQSNDESQE